ncbi:MAG: PAS domain S-box protein [Bacteroidia bacterium]|nr:PAS domain S-box protein [Bacteroidia bacterium]NNJ55909.1 PAS domain S-box protein [Bacteroidia bacterium]
MTSISKYQSIFETAIDGVIVIGNRGLIEEINSSALALFGYTKKEVIGNNVSMLMPEPDKSSHDQYISNYQKTRKPKIIGIGREVEGQRKDGSIFPFRLAVSEYEVDNKKFYTGIIHDLTKEKENERYIKQYSEKLESKVAERTALLKHEIELKEEAQEALIASQKLYETIAVNFPNGTITVLNSKLEIVFMEGSELKELGYGTKRLVGENYIDLIPLDVQDLVKAKVAEVFKGNEEIFEFGINQKAYKARCVPLFGIKGKIDQILLVINNVTREKHAEDEIYNALKKEKQLNELKTRFVSMASHEFRTPLSSILSSASLIAKYNLESQQDNRIKHIIKIKRNVQNLNLILNDFLSLEKIEGGIIKNNPEPIELSEFLNELVEESEQLTDGNQKLLTEFNHKKVLFKLDHFLLRNMLNNLLSNAIKYSSEDIILRTLESNSKLSIEVQDFGLGISEEDQKSLFNRFFRASNAGTIQGTGLGLNIVRRYANIMDAEVIFESKLNEGSKFSIIFKIKE